MYITLGHSFVFAAYRRSPPPPNSSPILKHARGLRGLIISLSSRRLAVITASRSRCRPPTSPWRASATRSAHRRLRQGFPRVSRSTPVVARRQHRNGKCGKQYLVRRRVCFVARRLRCPCKHARWEAVRGARRRADVKSRAEKWLGLRGSPRESCSQGLRVLRSIPSSERPSLPAGY